MDDGTLKIYKKLQFYNPLIFLKDFLRLINKFQKFLFITSTSFTLHLHLQLFDFQLIK